mmetsp:Transcript_19615/g.18693  ORF Transcript_19615/g.18693 Transcript_19615/m.18693 type:complete len:258 (-) Transcript_19615:321-1094(-)
MILGLFGDDGVREAEGLWLPDEEEGVAKVLVGGAAELVDAGVDDLGDVVDEEQDLLLHDLGEVIEVADVGEGEQGLDPLAISDLLQVLDQGDPSPLMLHALLDELLPSIPEAQRQQGPDFLDGVLDDLRLIVLILVLLPTAQPLQPALRLCLDLLFLDVSRLGQDAHVGLVLVGGRDGVPSQDSDLLNHPFDGQEDQSLGVVGKHQGTRHQDQGNEARPRDRKNRGDAVLLFGGVHDGEAEGAIPIGDREVCDVIRP